MKNINNEYLFTPKVQNAFGSKYGHKLSMKINSDGINRNINVKIAFFSNLDGNIKLKINAFPMLYIGKIIGKSIIEKIDTISISKSKQKIIEYNFDASNIDVHNTNYFRFTINAVYPDGKSHSDIKTLYLGVPNIDINVENCCEISRNETKNITFIITNPYSNKKLTNVSLDINSPLLNLVEHLNIKNLEPKEIVSIDRKIKLIGAKKLPSSSLIVAKLFTNEISSPMVGNKFISINKKRENFNVVGNINGDLQEISNNDSKYPKLIWGKNSCYTDSLMFVILYLYHDYFEKLKSTNPDFTSIFNNIDNQYLHKSKINVQPLRDAVSGQSNFQDFGDPFDILLNAFNLNAITSPVNLLSYFSPVSDMTCQGHSGPTQNTNFIDLNSLKNPDQVTMDCSDSVKKDTLFNETYKLQVTNVDTTIPIIFYRDLSGDPLEIEEIKIIDGYTLNLTAIISSSSKPRDGDDPSEKIVDHWIVMFKDKIDNKWKVFNDLNSKGGSSEFTLDTFTNYGRIYFYSIQK
jgi:hypothetical protein